ncbi:MAG: MvdC/MvdD family ATP grasp protein [Candidatus Berkiella sp.]
MKVLILTNHKDDHARVVAEALKKKNVTPIKWVPEEFLLNQKNSLYINSNGVVLAKINTETSIVNYHEIEVVWFRRPAYPLIPKNIPKQDKSFILDESRMNIKSMWFTLEKTATWINPLASNQRANIKVCQLQEATRSGMTIPETLVTNDRNEIIDFIIKNRKTGTIYKTFLPGCWEEDNKKFNCQTTAITVDMIPPQSLMKLTPGIYQKRIPKEFEVRATFFGDHYIAVKIYNTEELDWRLSSLSSNFTISPIKLPSLVEKQCLQLMQQLGIVFGCFDFIVTSSEEYVFLEVNEMGQFLWIEEMLPQLKILETFCDFLISAPKCNINPNTTIGALSLEDISNSKSYIEVFRKDMMQQDKINLSIIDSMTEP